MTDFHRDGTAATLRLGADLVASVAEGLRPELQALIQDGVRTLTVDLDRAEFLDSMGIGLLIAAHNSLAERRGTLAVVNVRPEVHRLLVTMRLDRHFRVEARGAGREP